MSVMLPLPSDRNFELYNAVTFGGLSLRSAATKSTLSTARIREICAQVERWILANVPEDEAHLSVLDQVRTAFHLHRHRLEYYMEQAMACFHGELGGDPTKKDAPNPKYLMAAMRLSDTKFRAHLLYAKLLGVLREEEQKSAPAVAPISPPARVCAPAVLETAPSAVAASTPVGASANDPYACDFAEILKATAPPRDRKKPDPARSKEKQRAELARQLREERHQTSAAPARMR